MAQDGQQPLIPVPFFDTIHIGMTRIFKCEQCPSKLMAQDGQQPLIPMPFFDTIHIEMTSTLSSEQCVTKELVRDSYQPLIRLSATHPNDTLLRQFTFGWGALKDANNVLASWRHRMANSHSSQWHSLTQITLGWLALSRPSNVQQKNWWEIPISHSSGY